MAIAGKHLLTIVHKDEAVLSPLTERYFGSDGERTLTDIYDEVFSLRDDEVELLKSNVESCFGFSRTLFEDAEDTEREFLQHFAFIMMLCVDVYAKKLLIEKLVDQIRSRKEPKAEPENKNTRKGGK